MTPEQQKNYLTEHLPYTLQMLRHTHAKVMALQNQLDWNAFYEAFAVSARNLDRFLTNKAPGNSKAQEFGVSFTPPDRKPGESIYTRMEAQVFHLAKKRPTGASADKVNTAEIDKFYRWVERATLAFFDALSPDQQATWSVQIADPRKPNPLQPSRSDRTTTSASQSISISPFYGPTVPDHHSQ